MGHPHLSRHASGSIPSPQFAVARGQRCWSTAMVVVLLASLPLLAQQGPDGDPDAAQGYVDNVFHHNKVDSVNLYNGQLTVPIAVGPSYPIGPSLKLQLLLTYNSKVWEYGRPLVQNPTGASTVLSGNPALGVGWTFTLGAIRPCNGATGVSLMCYLGPDGSERRFDYGDSRSGYSKTGDTSQLLLRNLGTDPSGRGPFEMWDGDGNRYVFNWHVSGFDDVVTDFRTDFGRGRDGWYLTSLTDPFNNGYSVSYWTGSSPCWTYANSCPYQAMTCTSPSANLWIPKTITLPAQSNNVITTWLDANQMLGSVTVPASGGGSATWSFVYQTAVYNETCGGSPLAGGGYLQANMRELQSLQLPSGFGSYQFAYSNPSNCVNGFLTHVQVPTGGTIDYAYGPYSFYHGRLTTLSQNCKPIAPDPSAFVEVSTPVVCPSGLQAQPPTAALGTGSCTDTPNYEDHQLGVVQRTETTSGQTGVTNYVQYAFPFGEQGTGPYPQNCDAMGRCGSQTLTVTVFPADVDGRRRGKATLFWSAPKNPTQAPVNGERTGADIEERDYDSDPTLNVNVASMPVCGGTQNAICSNRALRVTQRIYDYDTPGSEIGNRRLLLEKSYYGPTLSDGSCSTCAYHQVANSLLGSTTWDGNGRHYNIETHSGNLGADYRVITTTWSPTVSPWLPNLFDNRTTADATGTLYQFFDYDHSAQANGFLRGAVTWDATLGRLWAECRYAVNSQGTADGHGNVASRYTATFAWLTQPDQNTTCTVWRPTPSTWVGSPGNGDAFATDYTYSNGLKSSARPVNGSSPGAWLKYDVTRDPVTGWITASRDTAGQQTNYIYDALGRPTRITPPGEAPTVVTYDNPNQTTAVRSGGSDSSTWSQFQYDGFGRTIRERRLMPGGTYSKRFTKYDPRDSAFFQSEWVADSLGEALTADVGLNCASAGATYPTNVPSAAPGAYRACFDAYGRPQVTTGSGYSNQVTVSRTDLRFATPAYYSDTNETSTVACLNGAFGAGVPHCSGGSDSTTTTVRDAGGRITRVTEPSGDVTTYGYDVLGKLTFVTQGSQTRTFAYDRFGFPKAESTPEGGVVSYDAIDSLGQVTQQTQPGGLVIYHTYDYAGRLTGASTNEGGSRAYLSNAYDEAGHGYSLGKLTTSVSTNYALSTPSTVTDSYLYSGLGGRLLTKTQALGGSASLTTSQSFGYNSLGLLSSNSHPRTGSDPAFTVSWTFDAGLPVSERVNGTTLVSGISYRPSGVLSSYTTNNSTGHSVTTTISQDGYLPRPLSIQTSGASSNFSTGNYAYDGAGNVRAIGSDSFVYDNRSRLTNANIYEDLASLHQESFQYDRYGNILSRTADGSSYPFSIDPYTNRVTGSQTQYDSRGNMTVYGVSNYAYDGLSRQTSFKVLGTSDERYLYDAVGERTARVIPGVTTTSTASLYTITACRLYDSRTLSQPVVAQSLRTITAWNSCGIPTNAIAIAANVTSVSAVSAGYFRANATGVAAPFTSWAWVNAFKVGQARATNSVIPINGPTPGSFTVYGDFPTGTANLIIDVFGYFAPTTTTTPDTYSLTYRDPQKRLSTKYNLAFGSTATLDKDYVYLGNQLVATWQPSAGYSFFVTDHLGTPRLQTDVNASLLTRSKYRAFGQPLSGTMPPQGPEYASMEKDSASGNHYDHARFYTSYLGRFQVPDLLGGHPEDPQSWNRYAYARDNPFNMLDPDGRTGLGTVWYGVKQSIALMYGITPKQLDGYIALGGGVAGAAVGVVAAAGVSTATISSSVFQLAPVVRGRVIESILGTAAGGSLPSNFPTIDRFDNGVATSVKSMDLLAKTYQSGTALLSRLTGYVDQLANFNGGQVGRTVVKAEDVTERVLEVVVTPGANPSQLEVLQQVAAYARSQSVTYRIIETVDR